MSHGVDFIDPLSVQDGDYLRGHGFAFICGEVSGFACAAIAEEVRGDDPVAER